MGSFLKNEIPHLGMVVIVLALSFAALPFVPSEGIPVHWNARGEVDRYGGPLEALFLLPGIMVLMWALLACIPLLDPEKFQQPGLAAPWFWIRIVTGGVFVAIHAMIIMSIFNPDLANLPGRIIPIIIGVLMMVLGAKLPSIPPNPYMGIRTPWVFKSRLSWDKTHEIGVYGFLVMGIGFITAGIIMNEWAWIAAVGLTFAVIIALFWYSYHVYTNDPDPQPALDTVATVDSTDTAAAADSANSANSADSAAPADAANAPAVETPDETDH